MKSILVYVRPWNRDQFIDLARKTWPEHQVLVVSEHRSIDEQGLSKQFYKALSTYRQNTYIDGLSENDLGDVIYRCRLLRSIEPDVARQLVFSMNAAVETIIEKHRPTAALSVTVDSFLIHLMYLACKRRGIEFIGLVPTFVNGYFRVTRLGERTWSRHVGDDEINRVCQILLQPAYKPGFIAQDAKSVRKTAYRNWLRNLPKPLWFGGRRMLSRDVYNYHYYATQNVSKRHWAIIPQGYDGEHPVSRSDLIADNIDTPIVFLPLQMSPEATIDYWSTDTSWIDYENRVLSLLDKNSDKLTFAVKEHPNVLGNRTHGFYNRLKARKNCILVAPEISSNAMIDMCDAVAICTGSIGFEALLRGKSVFSDSNPYYMTPYDRRPISNLDGNITSQDRAPNTSVTDTTSRMKYLLEGILPGHFINNGTWNKCNQHHANANTAVSASIVRYIEFSTKYAT